MSWTSCQKVPLKAQKRYAIKEEVCCSTHLTIVLGQFTPLSRKIPYCSGICTECPYLSLLSAGIQARILVLSLRMQEGTIRGALHELPTIGVDQMAWRALADAVEISGSTGFSRYLGWQLFPVPNISGAQGETSCIGTCLNWIVRSARGDCIAHCPVFQVSPSSSQHCCGGPLTPGWLVKPAHVTLQMRTVS